MLKTLVLTIIIIITVLISSLPNTKVTFAGGPSSTSRSSFSEQDADPWFSEQDADPWFSKSK
jgi:hypothetical protein